MELILLGCLAVCLVLLILTIIYAGDVKKDLEGLRQDVTTLTTILYGVQRRGGDYEEYMWVNSRISRNSGGRH